MAKLLLRSASIAFVITFFVVAPVPAQIGTLVSPGPLSRAHANLEGLANCQKCHTPGREVIASKCLSCHKPIADRMAAKVGVHRNVVDGCVTCHVEHGGADVDLRRLDARRFDHATETGFALEGQHAKLVDKCSACHKKRTFLDARTSCDSCHTDVHKGTLGHECTRCHAAVTLFKETQRQFDHARARFLLTGAHHTVACAKCHVGGVYRGLKFDTCTGCHETPHRSQLGPSCTTCHVTDRWTTRTVEHSRTGFALVGQHAQVACERCHTSGITKALRFDRCSACHTDVHRNSIKEDCRTCHTETTFRGASFDHGLRTSFALGGKHAGLACRKCHKAISADTAPPASRVIDFAGAKAECASCHADEHKGKFGRTCDACHRASTFKASGFAHPRVPEFFAGKHVGLACEKCHVRATDLQVSRGSLRVVPEPGKAPQMTCDTCHGDVHLGQVGPACERCHTVGAERFAPARFSHEVAAFKLTGKHGAVECAKCHPVQAGTFPAGAGSARRLKPVSSECRSCHKDPHLGQVDASCTTCHSAQSFTLLSYRHRGLESVFGVGSHRRLPCRSCHKTETGQFPAGRGTTVRLKGLGKTCLECHP